ncbi:MAG: EF-hand domain-containing protein [Rhodanobacteraceae bacterium]
MKSRSPLLAFAVASLFATAAMAQDAMSPPPPPPPPAPPMQPMPPPPPPPTAQSSMPMAPAAPTVNETPSQPVAAGAGEMSTQMQTPQGTATINSGMPPATNYGPKPPFAQLDTNHDGRISQEEAQAYPLLYNDWIHVAHHAKSITKSQYAKWDAGT